ncbi:hypothetical protein NN561_012508 [Cricetulus griseus]
MLSSLPSPCAPRRGGNSCARRRRPRSERPETGRTRGSRGAPRRGRPLAHGPPRPLPGLPRAASERTALASSSSIFIPCPVGASFCQPALWGIPRQPTSPSKPPFARVPSVLCHPGCELVGLLLGLWRNSLLIYFFSLRMPHPCGLETTTERTVGFAK